MKAEYCEHEQAVVSALQRHSLSDELALHAGNCPVCSEIVLVTNYLQEESAPPAESAVPPDAGLIWRKAQARARENAMAKAALPIRIMRTCAVALMILASPWLALALSHPFAWLPRLDIKHLPSLDGNWLVTLTGTTIVGITAGFICIGLSSWYMLREK